MVLLRCILSKFYIKPQLGHNYPQFCSCCILSKFYIKPQQQTLKDFHQFSCILSKFYIKPQLFYLPVYRYIRCILSKFYIKPQLRLERELACCVVSYRNSTSNHNSRAASSISAGVVSYRNSTSNHNSLTTRYDSRGVVSYRNSTSNHNKRVANSLDRALYLIEILHQTTTKENVLYIYRSCILSKFYIKPQLSTLPMSSCAVVSYRNSTSNHNEKASPKKDFRLYLIEILHQTTTLPEVAKSLSGCILSKFYIKPQLPESHDDIIQRCILSKFYIKPQRRVVRTVDLLGCILSKFYIKPQLLKNSC